MSIQFSSEQISINNKERWNHLLYQSLMPSYRQAYDYNYIYTPNKTSQTYIFHTEGNDLAGTHFSIKTFAGGFIKIAELSSGIIWKDTPGPELLEFILRFFTKKAKAEGACLFTYSPWLAYSMADEIQPLALPHLEKMNSLGFKKLAKSRHTYWIDLAYSENEILEKMKGKTRYDIKRGTLSEIQISNVDIPDKNLINTFWKLYSFLGASKGFRILSEKKFKAEVFTLLKSKLASLFIAKFQNEIINISLASKTGIASYLHGAINPEFKKMDGCPPPGHLVQWHMMKTMKDAELRIYDMGFCPGPVPVESHPAYKIWRFKYGFGGMPVEFLPIYGKIIQPLSGRLIQYLKYRK